MSEYLFPFPILQYFYTKGGDCQPPRRREALGCKCFIYYVLLTYAQPLRAVNRLVESANIIAMADEIRELPAVPAAQDTDGYEQELEHEASEPGEMEPVDLGELAPYDPLRRYLAEIRRYPLLSPQEQRELAIRYKKYGDIDAAIKLATASLRLVVKIALQYQRAYMNLLDLIQEGNIGLLQAIRKFDPFMGSKFSSYAAWWIRAYILKYILDNWSLVRFGTSNDKRRLFFNLKREKERLEAAGYVPGPKLLAEKFGVSEEEIIEAEQAVEGRDLSLDACVGNEVESRHIDFLRDRKPPVDEQLAEEEYSNLLQEKFARFAETLKPRERMIFESRLVAEEPVTLQEIGDRLGITRERVRQLESKIIKKLKVFLKHELPYFKGMRISELVEKEEAKSQVRES